VSLTLLALLRRERRGLGVETGAAGETLASAAIGIVVTGPAVRSAVGDALRIAPTMVVGWGCAVGGRAAGGVVGVAAGAGRLGGEGTGVGAAAARARSTAARQCRNSSAFADRSVYPPEAHSAK
jgi:hypothetical protein